MLLLAVMSVLAAADCRDHILPSRRYLENGLVRWVKHHGSNEWKTTRGDVTQANVALGCTGIVQPAPSRQHPPHQSRLCRPDAGRGGEQTRPVK